MNIFSKHIYLIFCILIFSCDDKEASLEELNVSPTIEYFTEDNNYWDVASGSTVFGYAKVWTPSNNLNYSVVIRTSDFNNNFGGTTINTLSDQLNFFVNDTPYVNLATVPETHFSLAIRNELPTIKHFKISVEDTWGAQNSMNFEVIFLENQAPISGLTLQLINNITTNEYLLDATTSIDQDDYIGGFIVEYEYIIDDVVITIPLNQIYHVFNSGTHIIKMRCRDNDDVWSDQITRTLVVP